MKIVNHQKNAELGAYIKETLGKKGVPRKGSETGDVAEMVADVKSGADNILLSEKARDIQGVKKALDDTAYVRKEKVEYLKRKIESGSYNVKGEAIADKIIKASILDKII